MSSDYQVVKEILSTEREAVIDGWLVNGSARAVASLSAVVRHVQSGYLYHYAFAMILGLILLLGGYWLIGSGLVGQ